MHGVNGDEAAAVPRGGRSRLQAETYVSVLSSYFLHHVAVLEHWTLVLSKHYVTCDYSTLFAKALVVEAEFVRVTVETTISVPRVTRETTISRSGFTRETTISRCYVCLH